MGILESVKGIVTGVPAKVEEIRERIEVAGVKEQAARETEASRARLATEQNIRKRELAGTITPEMIAERRKQASEKYERDIKSTTTKIKEAVVTPVVGVRQRNIERMMMPQKQPRVTSKQQQKTQGFQKTSTKPKSQKMSRGQFSAPHYAGGFPEFKIGTGKKKKRFSGKPLDFDNLYRF